VRFYRGTESNSVAQLGSTILSPAFQTPSNTTVNLRIGSTTATTGDRTPPAWMDDVRIYDTALDAATLEAVRGSNIPEPTSAALLGLGLAAAVWISRRRVGIGS
jgi:hypothetical protein